LTKDLNIIFVRFNNMKDTKEFLKKVKSSTIANIVNKNMQDLLLKKMVNRKNGKKKFL
jgi:hypothetical protein